MMKLIVTGTACFIGCAVAFGLLERGDTVFGVDNHNTYYDPQLRAARVARLAQFSNYQHHKLYLADRDTLNQLFAAEKPTRVVNLAAQGGVRYSLEHPATYIDANIVGFMNVLEACRQYPVEHLVFASSSSVFGANMRMPFSEQDGVDHPPSLNAATKKVTS